MEVLFLRRSHILIDNCLKRHQVQKCLGLTASKQTMQNIVITNVE